MLKGIFTAFYLSGSYRSTKIRKSIKHPRAGGRRRHRIRGNYQTYAAKRYRPENRAKDNRHPGRQDGEIRFDPLG